LGGVRGAWGVGPGAWGLGPGAWGADREPPRPKIGRERGAC
jgi:hypothetical protein